MKIRLFLSILTCKLTAKLLQMLNKGGTSLPGSIAMFIYPDVLRHLSKGMKSILVTGTNGKTTVCRIIKKAMDEQHINTLSNESGANMLSGIVTSFCVQSKLFGENNYEYAVIESDEAALQHITKHIDAYMIVVTNLFLDQVDRFTDISITRDLIVKGIKNCTNPCIILNNDCPESMLINNMLDTNAVFFGVNNINGDIKSNISNSKVHMQKDILCPNCNSVLQYNYINYEHLGDYYCNSCSYSRQVPVVQVMKLIEKNINLSKVLLKIHEDIYTANINLPGDYNVYNAACATAALEMCNIEHSNIIKALETFEAAYGRMESIYIQNTEVNIILIKNTAGLNRVLNMLRDVPHSFILAFIINDAAQDGRDIAWIYEASLEEINQFENTPKLVYTSGTRALDMQERIIKTGYNSKNILVEKNYQILLNKLLEYKQPIYILPTYTAMYNLRMHIKKKYKI